MSFSDPVIQALSKAFDAPWPGPRGKLYKLASKDLEAVVCPEDGARIVSLKHKGTELLRQYSETRRAFQYGCFPMVPWVGRIKGGVITIEGREHYLYQNKGENAMHGMAHFDPWNVDYFGNNRLALSVKIGHPYPFACRVTQIIELNANANVLELSLILSSEKENLPVDGGWHPWFLKDPDGSGANVLNVSFKADCMEETGSNELPTGRRLPPGPGPYDDCFDFFKADAAAVLDYAGKRTIRMTSNCPALVVFDKQPDATCVNPMSGIPNGVNTEPHLIGPGKELVVKSTWSFS